ncbi:hypothetical protein Q1695_013265 [Nippostrongylus brasiliensis]|nr:hypothetical protein Q1695_013265 [Nippostrongylus brasiliensis]
MSGTIRCYLFPTFPAGKHRHHLDSYDWKNFLRAGKGNEQEFKKLNKLVDREYGSRSDSQKIFHNTFASAPSERNFKILNRKFRGILFNGDILISNKLLRKIVRASEARQQRDRRWAYRDLFYPDTIWQTGIPYKFDSDLPDEAVDSIQQAIEFWQNNTCVTFRPHKDEDEYVLFTGSMDMCSSSVGRDTSQPEQPVYIGKGCYKFGVTSHEVGHVIGLFHHQQRYDRDSYVKFVKANVAPSDVGNFMLIQPSFLDTYGLPYDIGSVMHYTPTEFAINPAFPAMLAVNENLQGTMGQMEGPSFLDVEIVNRHYSCGDACNSTKVKPKCLNGGYADPLKCSVCRCPTGFGGDSCQLIASSAPMKCGGLIPTSSKLTRLKIHLSAGPVRRQCVYHIRSPPNRRVMLGIVNVKGKCQEGCYTSAMEVKMNGDFRPMGYRYCCESQSFRRILSKGRNVPVIFFAQNGTLDVLLYFRWVVLTPDAEDETYLNATALMEVYKQTDNDNGMDMELLQLPEGSGMGTPGGFADDKGFGERQAHDDSASTVVYGGDGESYEDFSVYT